MILFCGAGSDKAFGFQAISEVLFQEKYWDFLLPP